MTYALRPGALDSVECTEKRGFLWFIFLISSLKFLDSWCSGYAMHVRQVVRAYVPGHDRSGFSGRRGTATGWRAYAAVLFWLFSTTFFLREPSFTWARSRTPVEGCFSLFFLLLAPFCFFLSPSPSGEDSLCFRGKWPDNSTCNNTVKTGSASSANLIY